MIKATLGLLMTALAATTLSAQAPSPAQAANDNSPEDAKPTVWLIGDSTVRVNQGDKVGWGEVIDRYFDSDKVNVVNRAIGGRSSRTFIAEGRWDKILEDLKPGDYVLMQFGHNDGGNINDDHRARGSIPGIGYESVEIDNMITGKHEIVYSYGHYMRQYVDQAQEAGATPIVCSPVAHEAWEDGKAARDDRYAGWAKQVAEESHAAFIDLHEIIARGYDELGPEKVGDFFVDDHTHQTREGAIFNAKAVVAGLKALGFSSILSKESGSIEPASDDTVMAAAEPNPATEKVFVPDPPRDPAKPTIWLIGDSTVKVSTPHQIGWGEVLRTYIDLDDYNLVNRAIGGRSSRTFMTEGRWDEIMKELKPGDYVFMQFGHNDAGKLNDDSRARGTIRGVGEESEEIDNMLTGKHETVYTYGHYMRQYVTDAQKAGATPVVCSLIPRKKWDGDTVGRNRDSYAGWAQQVAEQTGAAFVDLNEIIARGYERLGKEPVEAFFADAHTHTSEAGAIFNARAVVSGLKGLGEPFTKLLSDKADPIPAYPPKEWIDTNTGHKVIRLSEEPGTASLYFHQNPFTPDGKMMVVTTPHGISAIDLKTHEIKRVVEGDVRVLVVGRKTGDVYYTKRENDREVVYAAGVESGKTRKVAELPEGAGVSSVNADETLLVGTYTREQNKPLVKGKADAAKDGSKPQGEWMHETVMTNPKTGEKLTFAEQKEWHLNDRLEDRIPMAIYVVDTKTGKARDVYGSTDWLNHVQFSPTDPSLIMFCHEGPWHKVDRVWTIRTDGSDLQKIHTRTMNMEIAGHEFFGPDGETIWYDLQRPRGEVFWLAGHDLKSGKRTWYALDRNEWSVHYNVSPDGKLFAGDGGDDEMVAHAPDGKWIYLFRPETIPDVAGISAPNADDLINPGRLRAEKLVDMRYHAYHLEPNVHFTPDGKWIVFRSNMFGPTHVFAVEIAKPAQTDGESAAATK